MLIVIQALTKKQDLMTLRTASGRDVKINIGTNNDLISTIV
ncbi:hypothetical protein DSUL_50201 [Desulfovibrionales bacterium]